MDASPKATHRMPLLLPGVLTLALLTMALASLAPYQWLFWHFAAAFAVARGALVIASLASLAMMKDHAAPHSLVWASCCTARLRAVAGLALRSRQHGVERRRCPARPR